MPVISVNLQVLFKFGFFHFIEHSAPLLGREATMLIDLSHATDNLSNCGLMNIKTFRDCHDCIQVYIQRAPPDGDAVTWLQELFRPDIPGSFAELQRGMVQNLS